LQEWRAAERSSLDLNDMGRAPLFVDLDGTLIKSDTFAEGMLRVARTRIHLLLSLPLWLLRGRAFAKAMIERYAALSASQFPYRESLVAYLIEQKKLGRELHLATAAHWRVANKVAKHLGLFDTVIASDARTNLKGKAKLYRIAEVQQGKPFSYAGNSAEDRPLWHAAAECIFVNAPAHLVAEANGLNKIEKTFLRTERPVRELFRALRPHQWSKNALVFVPLLTSHSYFNVDSVLASLSAFVAFCLCASALYLLNDLIDIHEDRQHPRKRQRPLASGSLSLRVAAFAIPGLLMAAIALSYFALRTSFLMVLLLYSAISLLYSVWLKRESTLDVIALAGL
jgi:phosphoserine phosphatase